MAFFDFLKRLFKVRSTVLNDIWLEVLFFTVVAVLVTTITKLAGIQLTFSNQLMTVLGTALGFVISFRTSTAYERFTEGRLRWTDIAITSRNLAQIVWIQPVNTNRDKIDRERAKKEGHPDKIETDGRNSAVEIYIEKRSVINLVLAFSISVKHLLRGEPGVYYKDLYPLIAFLPRFHTQEDHATENDILPLWKASNMDFSAYKNIQKSFASDPCTLRQAGRSASMPYLHSKEFSSDSQEIQSLPEFSKTYDPESALPDLPSDKELRPAKDIPASFFSHYIVPFLKWLWRPFTRFSEHQTANKSRRTATGKKINHQTDSNVPMEIATFLFSYHAWLVEHEYISDAAAGRVYDGVLALQNAVVHLERIKNTPLPFAYQAHLRISVWLYLFFLPSQLYGAFSPVWLTIPATTIAAFIMLGFLEIGQEIENPFNYDATDLDLDEFCLAIQRELHEIMAHTSPHPPSYIFSHWNQPFAPADRRTAMTIVLDTGHDYHDGQKGAHTLRKVMLQSWEHVDKVTRQPGFYSA